MRSLMPAGSNLDDREPRRYSVLRIIIMYVDCDCGRSNVIRPSAGLEVLAEQIAPGEQGLDYLLSTYRDLGQTDHGYAPQRGLF